ncbi:MAG: hypothetical protein ACLU61_01005 [Lachnospiraceae bacterium]
MMKQRKLAIAALICMLLFGMSTAAAWAAPGDYVEAQGGVVTSEDGQGISPLIDTMYLKLWRITLEDLGGSQVRCAGLTTCFTSVKRVKVYLYLQKLVNGDWVTVEVASAYNENQSKVATEAVFSVEPNNTYRLMSSHVALTDSYYESTSLVTDSLWITN